MTPHEALESTFCSESDMARPATLRSATNDVICMPSAPATVMKSMKYRTMRSIVSMKRWSVLSIADFLSARDSADITKRIMSRPHTR